MLEYINILLGIISLVLIVLPIKRIASLMSSILTCIAPKNEKINKLKIWKSESILDIQDLIDLIL